jgi:hypothetical protein
VSLTGGTKSGRSSTGCDFFFDFFGAVGLGSGLFGFFAGILSFHMLGL